MGMHEYIMIYMRTMLHMRYVYQGNDDGTSSVCISSNILYIHHMTHHIHMICAMMDMHGSFIVVHTYVMAHMRLPNHDCIVSM